MVRTKLYSAHVAVMRFAWRVLRAWHSKRSRGSLVVQREYVAKRSLKRDRDLVLSHYFCALLKSPFLFPFTGPNSPSGFIVTCWSCIMTDLLIYWHQLVKKYPLTQKLKIGNCKILWLLYINIIHMWAGTKGNPLLRCKVCFSGCCRKNHRFWIGIWNLEVLGLNKDTENYLFQSEVRQVWGF